MFFDTPVCRAWVLAVSVQPFSEDRDANEAGNVSKIHSCQKDSFTYSFTSVVGNCCSEVSESVEGGHKTGKESFKDDSCGMYTKILASGLLHDTTYSH